LFLDFITQFYATRIFIKIVSKIIFDISYVVFNMQKTKLRNILFHLDHLKKG